MERRIRGLKTALVLATAGVAALVGVPAAQAATGPAPVGASSTLEVKSAVWGELHVGDCQQNNGTMVIRSDGTGDWSATTFTYHTHSGDVWHSSFDFYTTAGYHLFGAGTFDSPRMSDGNPPPKYNWGGHFTFNPADFNGVDIYKTIQHSRC
ncbi:DUF6294 family protein [Amycolatopsis sp. NPDC059021]|uniref:DUF6294 family protein n=1 Tax=Amycolatopsis sp. NPDC059021 TaxID=3346704 RepID=UPI00366F65A6